MKDTALTTAREAAQRLSAAEHGRRRCEAGKVEALCDLAVAYNLDDEELFIDILVDQRIQIGGTGTPLVSEMVSLEIAALLGIPAIHAATELSSALDLKYRHPRLYEAVINLEVEVDRAVMMTTRCRDLHPILLDEITDAWLRQQHKLTWTQAKKLIDRLVIQADPPLAAKKETDARSRRGVWVWGLNEGVMQPHRRPRRPRRPLPGRPAHRAGRADRAPLPGTHYRSASGESRWCPREPRLRARSPSGGRAARVAGPEHDRPTREDRQQLRLGPRSHHSNAGRRHSL
ncbi:MAG: hypothetical protein IPJ61_09800 [Tessaracoccus sp.]|uniref:DUF222 domain-containing protein n=1 Tax=Tessaracoccus sp. TaxID=1971211 RepID=UPI001EC9F757|nr:DUF222 domain-containing protein [Tessaracoccus sp.]MBK7821354.1 hypothetical protein [Tessaracoccus sp.]